LRVRLFIRDRDQHKDKRYYENDMEE